MDAETLFDLTDQSEQAIACDWIEEHMDARAASLLRRAMVPLQPGEDYRRAWNARFEGLSGPLPDTRDNRAYWPERFRADSVRLIVYWTPPIGQFSGGWVAELYKREAGTHRYTRSSEQRPNQTPFQAVWELLHLVRQLCGDPAKFSAAIEEAKDLPVEVVPIRLASEHRPEWWERE